LKYFPGILLFTLLFAATFAPAQEPRGEHAKTHENAAERLEREAEEEKPMPHELWWKLANFAVLAGGLGYLIAKNAGPYFRTRGEEIQQGIVDAAQVRAEAEARAAAIEKKIGNLSGEIETIRAASKAEMAAEAARVREETETQIAKVRRQAQMEIASATKHASLELKAYSAQLALGLAEKQIRQRLDQHTQEDLANAFVNDLRQAKAQQAGSIQ
jgi:F0F1-type ATP synthase membrane subunit b/b'